MTFASGYDDVLEEDIKKHAMWPHDHHHELLGRKSVSVQICMKDIFMEEKSGHDDLVLNQSHIKSLGG